MQRVPFPGTSGATFFTDGETVVKVLWEADGDDTHRQRGGLLRRTPGPSVLRARAESEVTIAASLAAAMGSSLLREASVTDSAVTLSMGHGVALAETSSCLYRVVADFGPDGLAAAIDCIISDVASQLSLLHAGLVMRLPNATVSQDEQRLKVLHGDVSPGNIVVDRDGRAHLIDFGCARWITDADVADEVPPLLANSAGGYTPQLADPRLMTVGCVCEFDDGPGEVVLCAACAPFERGGVPVAPDGTCDAFALVASVRAWLEASTVSDAGTSLPLLQALLHEGPLTAAALAQRVNASDEGRALLKCALQRAAAATAAAVDALSKDSDLLDAGG